MTQHVNRVATMLDGPIPEHGHVANRLVMGYARHFSHELRAYRESHPGQQLWIVMLDLDDPLVRKLEDGLQHVHDAGTLVGGTAATMFRHAAAARAAAAKENEVPTLGFVATWELASSILRFFAKNEAQAQAYMERARGHADVMALVCVCERTQIFQPWNDAGNSERERRRLRARRRGA